MRKVISMFSKSFKKYILISLSATILYAALQVMILSFLSKTGAILLNSISNTAIFFMLFAPLLLLVAVTLTVILYLYKKDTKRIMSHIEETGQQEQQVVAIETLQKVSAFIIDHVSRYNAEIKQWIVTKKQKGDMVPQAIEQNSTNIGLTLQRLSELSYVAPYSGMVFDDKPLLMLEQK